MPNSRIWVETNRHKFREYSAAYRARNPEKLIEAGREYRARNRERLRLDSQARRRKRAAEREQLTGKPRSAKCESCGEPARTVWDHDHSTGAFRGWICSPCNLSLGLLQDNPIRLRALADYIELHKTPPPGTNE